jgi:hypothetical protein
LVNSTRYQTRNICHRAKYVRKRIGKGGGRLNSGEMNFSNVIARALVQRGLWDILVDDTHDSLKPKVAFA